jgi:hypothetical protein
MVKSQIAVSINEPIYMDPTGNGVNIDLNILNFDIDNSQPNCLLGLLNDIKHFYPIVCSFLTKMVAIQTRRMKVITVVRGLDAQGELPPNKFAQHAIKTSQFWILPLRPANRSYVLSSLLPKKI